MSAVVTGHSSASHWTPPQENISVDEISQYKGSLVVHEQVTRRVLVLESDPRALHLIRAHLVQCGEFLLDQVSSAEEACERLDVAAGAYALVLLSYEALGERLFPLIHRIKQLSIRPNIPVIAMCLQRELVPVELALQAGADDYVTKPLRAIELQTRVERALQMFQLKKVLLERNTRLQEELKAARNLQQSLLPRSPFVAKDLRMCWSYRPHGYVAGDMLNAFSLGGNICGFYVADVCGHGAAAAMISVWLSHTLHPPAPKGPESLTQTSEVFHAMLLHPAYTCAYLESKLAEMKHDVYLTMLYAIIDVESRRLVYARCGHPYPIIQHATGECEVVEDAGGPAIGMGLGIPFTEHVLHYNQGERLFFYSDGLLEAESPEGEIYGTERCLQQLRRTHQYSIEEQINFLIQDVMRFQERSDFADDLTVFGMVVD